VVGREAVTEDGWCEGNLLEAESSDSFCPVTLCVNLIHVHVFELWEVLHDDWGLNVVFHKSEVLGD
jgi:hypothetical protein